MSQFDYELDDDPIESHLDLRCPACDYDLRGIPDTTKCAECGFAYERGQRMFRPSGLVHRLQPYGIMFYFFMLLVPSGGMLIMQCPNVFSSWPTILNAVTIGVTLVLIMYMICRGRDHHPYEFLSVDNSGIRWRIRSFPEVFIGWNDIERVSKSRIFFMPTVQYVTLYKHNKRFAIPLPACRWSKTMNFDGFFNVVKSRLEIAKTRLDDSDAVS